MVFPTGEHERLAAGLAGLTLGELRARSLLGRFKLPPGYPAAAARLDAGEPLQYVLGRAAFRRSEVEVGPGVLIPRPETEVVAGAAIVALERWPGGDRLAVDLGTGSGAIAAALADEVPGAQVVAVEVSDDALVWARRNLAPRGVRVVAGDVVALGEPNQVGGIGGASGLSDLVGKVAVVVANPPYLPVGTQLGPGVAEHEPAVALWGGGPRGLDRPAQFLAAAARLLRPGGTVVLEHDATQGAALRQLATAGGLFRDSGTGVDLTGRDRYLTAIKC
ncbi:MAG: peptide chain release factor N(5)-glutamine methyltransferase [Bifidobacteriaceae bacterium]|jgi:release factor glutamine methyltransferase|nr:peptide chain release factor N(5)-glutamine methyltransferase [Bifidobacteriaceae bacterium]